MRKFNLVIFYSCLLGWISSCSTAAYLGESSGADRPFSRLGMFLFMASMLVIWILNFEDKRENNKKEDK